MSFRITCYTLFDITDSGVLSRSRPDIDTDINVWTYKRNTQANFDTILQIVSMRSQPENISKSKKILGEVKYFGNKFQKIKNLPVWTFSFEIFHHNVFNDGESRLGLLYADCKQVPMILCNTESNNLPSFLEVNTDNRNIFFNLDDE